VAKRELRQMLVKTISITIIIMYWELINWRSTSGHFADSGSRRIFQMISGNIMSLSDVEICLISLGNTMTCKLSLATFLSTDSYTAASEMWAAV